ncbi:MAG: ATP-binding cassette domain-containing protein, partial [Oscillospiraceae bacterium]|nr:ATP-binding cassette domain-containing protein [Oscillospiraceae bacterium]
METFAVRDLSFAYPEQRQDTLSHLTFSIPQGQFVTLCGPSGCGKSTLLRQLKTVLAPAGDLRGEILFEGRPLAELDHRAQSERIGFVQQSPENQIVTDKVWHELAFGLESLGYDTPTIRSRVAEMASFFGIQTWFYQNVAELSGGQKQLLNLASIMAMQPSVLILDEPTSQLDPIAASDFLATIGKVNRELGTTILLTEHRLEEAFPLSDRVLVMDKGRIIADGAPKEVGETLRGAGHGMFLAMPTAMRVWASTEDTAPCPITVRDGRDWLTDYARRRPLGELPAEPAPVTGEETAIALEDVWFKYDKDLPDVVKGVSLEVKKGEFLALLGGNGTGKTTTLSLVGGLQKPYRGEIRLTGRVGTLPQNPQTLFVKKTVREDLFELFRGTGTDKALQEARVARAVQLCRLEELLDRHPYDLSGGEQQRAALAKVLLLEPDILLLDEPTKGLDAEFKQVFAVILKTLQRRGVTVFMVSHDVEFCAAYADRCALFFDGNIVSEGRPRQFFSGNSFYTTSANRMARSFLPEAVTPTDVMAACGGKLPPEPELPEEAPPLPEPAEDSADAKPGKLPL